MDESDSLQGRVEEHFDVFCSAVLSHIPGDDGYIAEMNDGHMPLSWFMTHLIGRRRPSEINRYSSNNHLRRELSAPANGDSGTGKREIRT